MPTSKMTSMMLTEEQSAVLKLVAQRWQRRLAVLEGYQGRKKIAQADVLREGLRLIVQREGLPWPEEGVIWGNNDQPNIEHLFTRLHRPEPNVFSFNYDPDDPTDYGCVIYGDSEDNELWISVEHEVDPDDEAVSAFLAQYGYTGSGDWEPA